MITIKFNLLNTSVPLFYLANENFVQGSIPASQKKEKKRGLD